ncbi:MAG: hypothetical protein A4E73_03755 [Syntrophaceae bacterium PtaU1.Bin231]|nr:MAG: hypothetical protein A4E73_03755 [Syntrophaceae bacterium PtaU1.Bin231]
MSTRIAAFAFIFNEAAWSAAGVIMMTIKHIRHRHFLQLMDDIFPFHLPFTEKFAQTCKAVDFVIPAKAGIQCFQ